MSSAERWPISVAPMVDCTDRHFRFFARQISRAVLLYTEMIVARAVLRGDRKKLLGLSAAERPVAVQLAGDDPRELAEAARIAEDYGYDQINFNVGCPSPRVTKGKFGACLMADPTTVARCVGAMRQAVALPVTVKHRIGIDGRETYADMMAFVRRVAEAGCMRFIVHARIARLDGLGPKQNRSVPPLRYDDVYRLKRENSDLAIEINGGVRDLDAAARHLQWVDGVMIGRAVYEDPWLLSEVDRRFYSAPFAPASRAHVIDAMQDYLEAWVANGGRAHQVTRHMLGLFARCPGARRWRRRLSVSAGTLDPHRRLLVDAAAEVMIANRQAAIGTVGEERALRQLAR